MERWHEWLIYAALVFLVVYAVFGFYQWTQIVRQNSRIEQISNKLRLDDRAWISPDRPTLKELVADQKPEIIIVLRNAGKTPANIVQSNVEVVTLPENANIDSIGDSDADYDGQPIINVVAPNGLFHDIAAESKPLPRAIVKQIENGDRKLVVFGTCIYRDAIDDKIRRTSYSFTWSPTHKFLFPNNRGNYMD